MHRHRLLAVLGALLACERAPSRALETPEPAPSPVADRPIRPQAPSGAHTGTLDAASVAVLQHALGSKDIATRLIAMEAVGDSHADALIGWLEHGLGDPEHDVRMAAVEALDRIHTPRALGLLASVRDDTTEELDVRAVAAGALLRITTEGREVR